MMLYILIAISFSLDMITMSKSKNTKDKIPYIIAMAFVCVLGVVYLKYGDDIRIIDRIFSILKVQGGV